MFVTGAGTGLGKAIALEFARLGASIVIASRKPEHLDAGREAIEALGAPVLTVACDIRDPEQIAAAFDAAEAAFGLPRRAGQQRGRELPGAGRGHVAERVAHRRRHHAQRHVLLLARVRPPPPRGGHARARSSTSARRTRGPAARASRTRAAAKAGVKNLTETLAVEWGPYGIQVNGLVPGLFPHEDMTADIQRQPRPHRRQGRRASPRCGSGSCQELGWAATFLASPYARFISGHTLVVDGANWQRRSLTNPPVVTVRDQMGKGPFGS